MNRHTEKEAYTEKVDIRRILRQILCQILCQILRHAAAVSSLCPDCHKKKTASVALSEEEQPDEEAKDEE
jgi:hypothetical protein